MSAAREQLLKQTVDAAGAVRDLALAHPVEPDTAYPLGEVVAQLGTAHRQLLKAITDYPHPLAAVPDLVRYDAAYLLTNLVGAVSHLVVRYHGQNELRRPERDLFSGALREALVQASLVLDMLGPLADVHQYAHSLAPDGSDPRWRAAAMHAAAFAEHQWTRAVRPQQTVHELGLAMLAVSLFVVGVEHGTEHGFNVGPETQLPLRAKDLLAPVATDPLWATASTAGETVNPSLPIQERHQEHRRRCDGLRAERDQRMTELTSHVETTLVVAGVDLHHPGPQHRVLVAKWRYLQEPAPSPRGSDLGINNYMPPYTWREHLAEGAVRAYEYLATTPATPTMSLA